MFSKGVLFVVSLLMVASQAIALKCYVCAGSNNSDCAHNRMSSMVTQVCQGSSISSNPFIIDMETRKDTNVQSWCINLAMSGYQPHLIARGCANVPSNVDPCTYLKQFPQIKVCIACNTDLCNGEGNEK